MNEHMVVTEARRRAQTWVPQEPHFDKPVLTMSQLLEVDVRQRAQEGMLMDAFRFSPSPEFFVECTKGLLHLTKWAFRWLGFAEG